MKTLTFLSVPLTCSLLIAAGSASAQGWPYYYGYGAAGAAAAASQAFQRQEAVERQWQQWQQNQAVAAQQREDQEKAARQAAEETRRAKEAVRAERQAAIRQQQNNERMEERARQITESDKQDGYKPMTIQDFTLDGKALSDTESKVSMVGVYTDVGRSSWLFPSMMAMFSSKDAPERGGILVISDDAARNTRRDLMNCTDGISGTMMRPTYCAAHLRGRASMCELSNALGISIGTFPCLVVESGGTLAAN